MKILIDLDEVCAQWSNRMVELWNAEHPDRVVKSVGVWSTDTFLGQGSKFFVRSHMRDVDFWANLEPVPGAVAGIRTLVSEGHDVRIVTQVLPEAAGASYEGKLKWIKKHLPEFDLGHVIVTKDKASVSGDVLFDDAPHQLSSFPGRAVALRYEWNKDVPNVVHVDGWPEFVQWIRDYVRTENRPEF